jgi:hypothetical protein
MEDFREVRRGARELCWTGAPSPDGPTAATRDRVTDRDTNGVARRVTRLSTETKAAFKTTEFFPFVAVLIGILIGAGPGGRRAACVGRSGRPRPRLGIPSRRPLRQRRGDRGPRRSVAPSSHPAASRDAPAATRQARCRERRRADPLLQRAAGTPPTRRPRPAPRYGTPWTRGPPRVSPPRRVEPARDDRGGTSRGGRPIARRTGAFGSRRRAS